MSKKIDTNKKVGFVEFDALNGLKVGNNCYNLLNWNDARSGNINAYASKMTAFLIYFYYFSNIAMSLFDYEIGDIPQEYVKRALFQDAQVAFYTNAEEGGTNEVQAGTFISNNKFNHYGLETSIKLTDTLANTKSDVSVLVDKTDFEILYANFNHTPLIDIVTYFCAKITALQTAVDNNVKFNSLPLAVECTSDQLLALNNIIQDVANQNAFLYFKKDRGIRPEELFKSLDLNIEFKADKMLEIINYYKGEFYTMLGINSTPYEKKERLIRDEVKSNEHILALTQSSMFKCQQQCIERINKKYNVDFKIIPNLSTVNIIDFEETAESTEVEEMEVEDA